MGYPKKPVFISMLVFLLLIPTHLFGKKLEPSALRSVVTEGTFVLTVEENLVSLKARKASLKTIVAEIGRKMDIEVLGDIPEKETMSIEFDQLPLAQALERLSSNYGYQMKSEKGGHKISKIFVLPKGTGTGLSRQALKESEPMEEPEFQTSERVLQAESAKDEETDKETPARPEPFTFEFDPSAFLGK